MNTKTYTLVSGYVCYCDDRVQISSIISTTDIPNSVSEIVKTSIFADYVKSILPIKNSWEKDFIKYQKAFVKDKYITGEDIDYKFKKNEKVYFVALKYGDDFVQDLEIR